MARKKKISLRQVPSNHYKLLWDKEMNLCLFDHASGLGGPVACGCMDATAVFSDGERLYVTSINYARRYACVEAYKEPGKGVDEIIIYESHDIKKIFGDEFASHSPKDIAKTILSS